MKQSYLPLRLLTVSLLIGCAAVLVTGCPQREAETTTAPPGTTAPGPPGGGPSGAPDTGATTGDATTRTPGEAVSDVTMTAKVKNALMVSKVDTGQLDVDTKEGVVTLKGSVPTASQKALAEKVAKQVEGVTTVKNQLSVGGKG
jgi:hypothetical protein